MQFDTAILDFLKAFYNSPRNCFAEQVTPLSYLRQCALD